MRQIADIIERRTMIRTILFGGLSAMLPTMAFSGPPARRRRPRNRRSSESVDAAIAHLNQRAEEPPRFLDYAAEHPEGVHGRFQSSLFAIRTTGDERSEEYKQMIKDDVVSRLDRRRISLPLNRRILIRDTWYNPVTFGEVRHEGTTTRHDPIFVAAYYGTDTGPGPQNPLFVRFVGSDEDRYYGDRAAWIQFWDHTIRIKAPSSGGIEIICEPYGLQDGTGRSLNLGDVKR